MLSAALWLSNLYGVHCLTEVFQVFKHRETQAQPWRVHHSRVHPGTRVRITIAFLGPVLDFGSQKFLDPEGGKSSLKVLLLL